MRRSWIALLVLVTLSTLGCAHPTEDPLPGESTAAPTATPRRPSTSTPTGSDQTEAVCDEALDRSDEVVAQVREKIADAQANPATATATLITLRATVTGWKSDLEDYADRPIRSDVRKALNDGIDVIDGLLDMAPQELAANADQAQEDIQGFLDELEEACS